MQKYKYNYNEFNLNNLKSQRSVPEKNGKKSGIILVKKFSKRITIKRGGMRK